MIWLWVQSLVILGLVFALGLWIGDWLAHEIMRPKQAPRVLTDFDAEVPYHGHDITETVPPKPIPITEPAAQPATPRKPIYFPVNSFGAMTESATIDDADDKKIIISPLATLSPEALEQTLARVETAIEPIRFAAPSEGPADSLEDISGIGVSNARALNALGVYYFRQIATWSAEEVVWVAQHIHFPDRIVREQWIKQAAERL